MTAIHHPPRRMTKSAGHPPRLSITEIADRAVRALQQSADVCVMAQAATDIARELIDSVSTVDVSLVTNQTLVPVARSGEAIPEVYIAMADCGGGPPFAAVEQHTAVVATSLATDRRWPCFGPKAAARGVGGVVSLGVELGHESCAMSFWFARGSDIDDAVELHTLLIGSLLGAAAPFATEASNLYRALRSRDVIGQAKGILMERHRVSEDGAFDMLVDASSRTGHKLVNIAERLARTGEVDGWKADADQ